MLTQEEKQIVEHGQSQGKTKEEVLGALSKYRASKPQQTTQQDTGYSLKEAGGDILETFKGMGEQAYKAGEDIVTRDIRKPEESISERIVGTGADFLRGIGRTIGEVAIGAGKLALPQEGEEAVKGFAEEAGKSIAETDVAKDLMREYESLSPEMKTQVDNILGYLEGLSEIGTAGIAPKVFRTVMNNVKRGVAGTAEAVATTATNIPKPTLPSLGGTTQILREQAERIPRAIEKGGEAVKEAQQRALRMEQATPAVKEAIKTGVDDRIINTVTQADEPTKQAYKEMLDIAGEAQTTLKPKSQPSLVAGKAAESTYDILEKERKRIGGDLEKEIANLPKGTVADMGPSLRQVEAVLADNGITITDEGVRFAGRYTNAQRARINELVGIINELPEQMTAKQVREMDSLLSQLQRESRMEGLQDILVDVNGEKKNMFQLFRESYTNQLENINPRIRELNREYRNAKVLLDDLEDTIFKSGNYESIKGVDQAQFAKTNLRRIMGEAQSSPAYAEILAKMDARARELGYTGAKAEDLIYFAEELRKLYPDTIPKTGFQGSTITGNSRIMQLLETVMGAGKPDLTDQQKALKGLLEEVSPTEEGVLKNTTKNVPESSSKNTTLERATKAKTQGGFVMTPFSKSKVSAIDAQTKKDLLEAIDYIKSNEYSLNKQRSLDALARKYEIPVESGDVAKVTAYIRRLLDKTKTPETLPATFTRKQVA